MKKSKEIEILEKQGLDEEKIKLLKTKTERKSISPMGTIYPKKIRRILEGESPNNKFYYNKNKQPGFVLTDRKFKHSDGNVYDIYEKDNKNYIKPNGLYVDIRIFEKDLGRVPFFCPICGKIMKGKADEKFYYIRGKCTKCVIKDETKYRVNNLWDEYQKHIILNNQLSYLKDVKSEMEYYLNGGLRKTYEYHNEDGKIETWKNEAYKSTITFIKKELSDVKKYIKNIIEELTEIDLKLKIVSNNG